MSSRKISVSRSPLSRRIIISSIAALAIWSVIVILAVVFCRAVLSTKVWYDYQWEWKILSRIDTYKVPFVLGVIGFGAIIICLWDVFRVLKYLDEIIAESEKLVYLENGQIQLSSSLNDVQNKMNMLRENAIRSENIAKEAEQRKNDLIVYLAHDLKTPLTSIIGYLSLMQDEPDISLESRAKYTGIALEKAERLEELINEFFDITRFNLTHIELETERINFSRMIEQTASEFQPILAEKGLNFKMFVSKDIQLVCDADKMARVIDNLIKNAVNYSYPDSDIKISLYHNDSNIYFIVENNGKTIPEEKLNRIFEQFFRLDTSRGTKSGGAGLGLAIAKEIVEMHNGTITAYSENETIKFTLKLPL